MSKQQQKQPKVLFISTWINNPEMIPIQEALIKKFCQEDAKFLAVLDGKTTPCFTNFGDPTIRTRQIETCKKASITYVEVPPEFHKEPLREQVFSVQPPGIYTTNYRNYEVDPSSRTALANQYGWRVFRDKLAASYDYLVMIQSDVFPFRSFSVREMLDENSLLYKEQYREPLYYAWDGFLMFDFTVDKSIPWNLWNFESGMQNANIFTDTGGGTWAILQLIQKKKNIDTKNSLQWIKEDPYMNTLPPLVQKFLIEDIRNEDNKIFSEIKHHHFIHLRGGGNWEFIQNLEEGIILQTKRFQNFTQLAKKLLVQ